MGKNCPPRHSLYSDSLTVFGAQAFEIILFPLPRLHTPLASVDGLLSLRLTVLGLLGRRRFGQAEVIGEVVKNTQQQLSQLLFR